MATRLTVVACLVLLAALGIAALAHGAKAKKVTTEIEIEGLRSDFIANTSTFVGDVHSRQPKCERKREVTLRYTGPGPSEEFGTATTDRTGDFEITVDSLSLSSGDYVAEVGRRKAKKGGKKLKCRAATSEPIVLN